MKTIVACVDFSDVSRLVTATAARLASAFEAELRLVHVVPIQAPPVAFEGPLAAQEQDVELDMARARAQIDAMADELTSQGVQVSKVVHQGDCAGTIVDEATRCEAGLIVMGSHGHGALYHLLMGGTTQGVLKKAPCPVVVVPSPKAKKAQAAKPE